MALAVLGLRGSGSYSSSERPQSYRETILLLFPNGKAPLTALLSKLRSQSVDDSYFHWAEKSIPTQRTTATASFTAVATTINVTDSSIFRAGHVIMDESTNEVMYVTADPVSATQIAVQRGFGTAASASTGAADALFIIGNANAEGAGSPNVVYYSPGFQINYTQIFRSPLFLTRTAQKTRLRTGNARAEAKREALELHSIEMEKAFLWGQAYTTTGANGQPMNTTGGILSFLGTGVGVTADTGFTNVWDFSTTVFNFSNWKTTMMHAMKYGDTPKLLLCGSTLLNQLDQLVRKISVMNLVPDDGSRSYGMELAKYITSFGTLYIKLHPLLSTHPTYTQYGIIVDLDKLVFRYIDDTDFRPNVQTNDTDGEKDEWLTEAGLEVQHQAAHTYLKNVSTFSP